ncbi:MAG TPA: LytR C-terminal domain-containing protein [Methylophilus sp.]
MHSASTLILCLIASNTLMGCSSMAKSAKADKPKQLEVTATTNYDLIKGNSAYDFYEIAKRYHANGNLEMASIAYQKSLKLDSNYVKSISGLASIYAGNKLYTIAIPLFEQVVKIEPKATHYNNLGYAYYLNQQYQEASRVLSQAILLDPEYVQAKVNIALVESNLSAEKDIKQLKDTQEKVDFVVINNDDRLITQTTTPQDNIDKQVVQKVEIVATTNQQTVSLQQTTNGIYELNFDTKLNNAAVTAETTQTISEKPVDIIQQKQIFAAVSGGITFKHVPVVSKLFDLATTGIVAMQLSDQHPYMEVINGNGLKGIARAVAGQLKDRGVEHIKVADAKRFNLTKTHIQYRTGYRNDAMTLNEHLINRPYLVRNDQMPRNVSVRLVLGRDLMKNLSKAEIASINNAITSHEDVASI